MIERKRANTIIRNERMRIWGSSTRDTDGFLSEHPQASGYSWEGLRLKNPSDRPKYYDP